MNPHLPTRRWGRDLLFLAGFSLMVTFIVYAFWVSQGGTGPLPASARGFAQGLLYAILIGGFSWLLVPQVAHAVWQRHPVARWGTIVASLLATSFLGTTLAAAILYFGFGVDNGVAFPALLRAANRSTLPITLMVGVVMTIIEANKHRLQATELKLRTQQWERERAEKLAAEAQLASLAARVQPHFLFNTLNSISALIRGDPARAEQMIERLSSLLRSSLDPTESVPLEQEFKLVTDYLEIQRARFGQRLRYEVSVEPGAAAAVPPFAVQTVVENALKHVAGQRQEGVARHLSARRENGGVVVEITDDGPGFSPESLQAGHGLDILQSRLRAQFGERAGLEFQREPHGMTVRLRVPAA